MSYAEQNTVPSHSNTITAFYDDRAEADRAIERLAEAGIPRSAIQIIADNSGDTTATAHESKGFWAALGEFFMADDDRNTYGEGIRRGGYLVTVSGYPLDLHDRALDILDDEGSIDIDERSKAWESEGWSRSGSNESFASSSYDRTSGTARSSTLEGDNEEVIPVVEEELRVGKRDVNNGRVRVRSYVTETPVSESVSLRDEDVEVTRRTVDRPLTGADNAFVDRTIEAEEHREEAIVSKDVRVVEEIALKKTAEQRQETVSDSVRKTEVEVEDDRTGGVRNIGSSGIPRD
ncbi:YsnF/AvaK domain-containing protein (plasmid) [Rhizobium sp. 32-5/1]|uniref:YsnF/AvaK domain-containing protein n=1 Tax=Rhizobium sp. 32-5/1 TaxID=3019602 RepID=UPI00240E4DD1|nr:YsnF/AvaK domain-containing protein [Rhizobium sp. 32-5/1]WEZ85977.1 YsnF/AvaK domain-containing protein [Rhizobium sp. 32-5/1]